MNLAVAQEPRILKPRDQTQHPRLLAPFEVILKADKVIAIGAQIFFAQLHHGPWRFAGARIAQADGLHRPEAERVAAATRQNLDGQTAFEIIELLPLLRLRGLSGQQRVEKAVVLFASKRAVDVVGRSLVPARSE